MMDGAPTLRPLRIGEVLDVAIKIVWRNAKTLVLAVLVVVLPLHALGVAMTLSTVPDHAQVSFGAFNQTTTSDTDTSGAYLLAQMLTVLLSMLAATLALGACFKAIGDAYLGAQPNWRDSLRFVVRRLHSVLWVTVLIYTLSALAMIPVILPGIWLWVSWTVAVPALLLEGYKGRKALRRSFRLVSDRWWATFAAVTVGYLLTSVVGGIITALAVAPAVAGANSTVAIAVNGATTIVSALITTPFQAAIAAVIYFDLRVRKEGFDLELLATRLGLPAPQGAVSPAPVGPASAGTGAEQPPYWPPPPGWRPQSAAED
jgi:hypothetical protein